MAINFIRSWGKEQMDGGESDTDSQTGSLIPAVGNHLFVLSSYYDSNDNLAGVASVTDNQGGGNVYAKNIELAAQSAEGFNACASIHSAKVVASSGTFTVTLATHAGNDPGDYMTWGILEFSGVHPVTHLDKTGSNTGATTASDANVTATAANFGADRLVIAVCTVAASDATQGLTDPSGYTQAYIENDNSAHQAGWGGYKIVSAVETSSATWTQDNVAGGTWTAALATYIPALGNQRGGLPSEMGRRAALAVRQESSGGLAS